MEHNGLYNYIQEWKVKPNIDKKIRSMPGTKPLLPDEGKQAGERAALGPRIST